MLIFLAIFFFSHQRKNSLIEKESKKKKMLLAVGLVYKLKCNLLYYYDV